MTDETEHLLESPANAARLRGAVKQVARPKVVISGACHHCGGAVRVATCVCSSCGCVTIVPDDGE